MVVEPPKDFMMDEGQNFCLQWNSYQTSVTSLFNDLRRDGELVDVTLCAQGQHIQVHKMMLSACSPYFRDVLKGNLGTHPVFFMRDMSFKDLSNIVEFMYRGKVNVAQSELGSFLKTAETLQVRGLTGEDEATQPEPQPPKKSKPAPSPAPPPPPPPRLSPEPPRQRLPQPQEPVRQRPLPEVPRQRLPQPAPLPPPPPPTAPCTPPKRALSLPSAGDELASKRPRSVDQQPAELAASAAAAEPLLVKEEPLVLDDGEPDIGYGGGGENSTAMTLVHDDGTPSMAFLGGTPMHHQAHEFQDEDLLAAVAGPSGFPSSEHTDNSTTPGGRQRSTSDLECAVLAADGALRYQCPICHKLITWSNRSHHKAIHRGLTTCRACCVVFGSRRHLRTHKCPAALQQQQQQQQHQPQHQPPPPQQQQPPQPQQPPQQQQQQHEGSQGDSLP